MMTPKADVTNAWIIRRIKMFRRRGGRVLKGWLPTQDAPRLVTLDVDAVLDMLRRRERHTSVTYRIVVRGEVAYLLHPGDPVPPMEMKHPKQTKQYLPGAVTLCGRKKKFVVEDDEDEPPLVTSPAPVVQAIMTPVVKSPIPTAVGVAAIMTPLRQQFERRLFRRG